VAEALGVEGGNVFNAPRLQRVKFGALGNVRQKSITLTSSSVSAALSIPPHGIAGTARAHHANATSTGVQERRKQSFLDHLYANNA
jgi:hypothetical protein